MPVEVTAVDKAPAVHPVNSGIGQTDYQLGIMDERNPPGWSVGIFDYAEKKRTKLCHKNRHVPVRSGEFLPFQQGT